LRFRLFSCFPKTPFNITIEVRGVFSVVVAFWVGFFAKLRDEGKQGSCATPLDSTLHTDVDVADSELLYAPIWFARYDHKGNKIVLVVDANSGAVNNSFGL